MRKNDIPGESPKFQWPEPCPLPFGVDPTSIVVKKQKTENNSTRDKKISS